jgi:hypothetical protein
MDNALEKTNLKFDSNGNQIINEETDGRGKIKTIKFGLIKLMGEKKEYRVSYKTLLEITSTQKSGFTGKINIPEINMSVQTSQIVMMRSEIEEIRVDDDFTKLPVEELRLDENFNILSGSRMKIEKEHDKYYRATCHYAIVNDEKQYYLEPNQIQYLLTMVREVDPDYPHRVQNALRYGRDIWEIHNEQYK